MTEPELLSIPAGVIIVVKAEPFAVSAHQGDGVYHLTKSDYDLMTELRRWIKAWHMAVAGDLDLLNFCLVEPRTDLDQFRFVTGPQHAIAKAVEARHVMYKVRRWMGEATPPHELYEAASRVKLTYTPLGDEARTWVLHAVVTIKRRKGKMAAYKVYVPDALDARLKAALDAKVHDLRARSRYGLQSQIITELLTRWLDELAAGDARAQEVFEAVRPTPEWLKP